MGRLLCGSQPARVSLAVSFSAPPSISPRRVWSDAVIDGARPTCRFRPGLPFALLTSPPSSNHSDEILKAAGQTGSMRSGPPPGSSGTSIASSSTPSLAQPPPRPGQSAPAPSPRLANARPQNQQLHDPGPVPRPNPSRMDSGSSQQSRHGGQPQQNGSGLRPQEPPRSASAQSGNYQSRPGQQPDPRLDPRAQGGGRPPPQQQQQGGYDPRSGPPPQHQQQQQQGGYDPRYGPPPGQQQHQQQQQQGQQRPPMGQQHSSGRGRF